MPTAVTSRVTRGTDNVSPFAVAWEDDLKLSHITVASTTARDAIPEWKRIPYMTVKVIADNKYYTLGADVTIAGQSWTEEVQIPTNVVTNEDIFDEDGYIRPDKIRNVYLNESFVVDSEEDMLSLTTFTGNFVIRTDTGTVYVKLNNDNPSEVEDFSVVSNSSDVISVNGQTGVVVVTIATLLANSTNLTDFNTAVSNNSTVSDHSSALSNLTGRIEDLESGSITEEYVDTHFLGQEFNTPAVSSLLYYDADTASLEWLELGNNLLVQDGALHAAGGDGGSFFLTDGNGTVAGFNYVDLGGTLSSNVTISGDSQYNFTIEDLDQLFLNAQQIDISAETNGTISLNALSGSIYLYSGNTSLFLDTNDWILDSAGGSIWGNSGTVYTEAIETYYATLSNLTVDEYLVLQNLAEDETEYILYYDPDTGIVSQGAVPSGGGFVSQTLTDDVLIGGDDGTYSISFGYGLDNKLYTFGTLADEVYITGSTGIYLNGGGKGFYLDTVEFAITGIPSGTSSYVLYYDGTDNITYGTVPTSPWVSQELASNVVISTEANHTITFGNFPVDERIGSFSVFSEMASIYSNSTAAIGNFGLSGVEGGVLSFIRDEGEFTSMVWLDLNNSGVPFYITNLTEGVTDSVLYIDPEDGRVYMGLAPSGGGTTYTAGNGLTLTESEFGLGGTLSEEETTIDLNGNGLVFDGGLGYMNFTDVSYFAFTNVEAFQVNSNAYDITTPGNPGDYISLANDTTSLEVLTNTIRLFTGSGFISWGISDGTNFYPKFWASGFDTGTATNVLYHDPESGEITTAAIPSGGVSDGDKGDITVSSSGSTWTIDDDAVTYAKIQNVVADNVILGNISGAGSIVEELTGTEVTALLDLFSTSSTTKGLVPGAEDVGAGYYLDATGSWSIPDGGSFANEGSANAIVKSDGTDLVDTGWTSEAIGILTGTNSASPPTVAADTAAMYVNDVIAGNAAFHFKTELGQVIKLYKVADYTISNWNTLRTLDATDGDANLNTLMDFILTLVDDLKDTGLIG